MVSLAFRRYPFIHLGGERHCENKVSCPRTQHNVRGQGSLRSLAVLSKLSALRKRESRDNKPQSRSFLRLHRYAHAILAASPIVSTKPKNRTAKLRRLRPGLEPGPLDPETSDKNKKTNNFRRLEASW